MKLKALMEERNMSASELAEALGVSQRRLQSWMYGEREPPIRYLIALADALCCTVDELIGRK